MSPGEHRSDGSSTNGNDLSKAVMGLLAVGTFLLLAYNIIYDSRSSAYEGYPVTLVLGGLLGGFVGARRFIGGGDK